MTALPAAVVERCVEAYGRQYQASIGADLDACVGAALAEFLAIIEERAGPGWRIEGCDGADGFTRTLAELLEGERR